MNAGLYLSFTALLFFLFAAWLRSLVLRRLKPERILADLNAEIRTLIAEINQVGDHNISLLEDRVSQLSGLVQRTDRQIDEARMVLEYLESRREEVASSGAGNESGNGAAGGADRDVGMERDAGTNHDAGTNRNTAPEGSVRDNTSDLNRNETVLMLYNQGLSEDLIASRTGLSQGEVELIISLRGKRTWR